MKKILTTLFCLSVLAIGSQSVMAQGYDNGNPPPKSLQFEHGKRPPHVSLEDKLNLTDKQKAQVKANRIKARKEMKPIITAIGDKKEAILDVMDSDLPKDQQEVKIKALKEEIKALHKQANTLREKNMKEFENLLTAEQKVKFEKIKKEHQPSKGHKPSKKFNKKYDKKFQK